MGLDGCKKESKGAQDQAPATTSAAPSADQLYQLVAPIALFPDNLIAQVLAASTYPDQVTEAWNWLQQNKGQQAQALMQAVNGQSWDVSVKGLTQFPDVMQQMAGNLSWTSALGDAYYNSPQNVMNAVQVMRQRAYQAGNLKTTPQQNVSVQNEGPAAEPAPASSGDQQVTVVQSPPQTIVIQPSQPDVVYVPTYNPTVVYGAPVAAYPGYSTGDMVATGLISFGLGMAVGAAMSGGCCGWGWNSWGCGWNNSSVTYNRNVYVSNSNTFANRSNYYNRNNVNNINRNNINRNDVNRANLNRNDIGNNRNGVGNNRNGVGNNRNGVGDNRNGVGNNRNDIGRNNNDIGRNNRGGEFGSTPRFDSNRNQAQFRDQGRGNNAGQRASAQPTVNQRDSAGRNQGGQQRASQNNRQAVRGYGDQASRGNSGGGLGNYGQGGNARANSTRGQQSLNGGGANRATSNASARSGSSNFGGADAGARSAGGGGGASRGGGGGGNRGGGGSRGGGRR
jgi:hypothetical protein